MGIFIRYISASMPAFSYTWHCSSARVFCNDVVHTKEDSLSFTFCRQAEKSAASSLIFSPLQKPAVSMESASVRQEKQYRVKKATLSIKTSLFLSQSCARKRITSSVFTSGSLSSFLYLSKSSNWRFSLPHNVPISAVSFGYPPSGIPLWCPAIQYSIIKPTG